jgi:hypothetical protein
MAARDIPASFQAVLDRLNRPRLALIDEVKLTLSILQLGSADLPAISDLLDALVAGVADKQGEVHRHVEYLKNAIPQSHFQD